LIALHFASPTEVPSPSTVSHSPFCSAAIAGHSA
jgi:hypothetical protein